MPIGSAKLLTTRRAGPALPVPNAPTVNATTGGTTTLNLSWTNTSGTHQVRVYRGATLLATLAAGSTSYQATGLTANTAYSFTLRYFNGTTEGASSAATSRMTAPNAPSIVSATGISTSTVRVTWTNAHGDVSTVGYTSNGTSFATVGAGVTQMDRTGLSQGTTWGYYVAHMNAEGTLSSNSATLNATTLLNPPTNLTFVSSTATAITMQWTNGSSSHQTRVYRGGTLVTTLSVGTTQYTDSGLTSGTSYSYTVRHLNSDGTESAASNTLSASTTVSAPSSLTATPTGPSSISLSWTNGTPSYQTEVYRDGNLIATVSAGATSFNSTSLLANTQYSYQIRHTNGTITSALTSTVFANTLPNAPSSLSATFISGSQVNLAWSNSHSLTTYIYRDGGFVNSVSAGVTSFADVVPTTGQFYSYTVRHYNSNTGLLSAESNTANVNVPSGAPTAPNGLSAIGTSPSTVNIVWTNTDQAAQTRLYRNGSLLTTVAAGGATGSYNDTGLPSATSYTYYAVHLKNGLESPASNSSTATTLLNAPTSLLAQTFDTTLITLSWAVTDTTAQVRVYRNGSLVTTLAAQTNSYFDNNRAPNTQYTYAVRHFKNSIESTDSNSSSAWTTPSSPVSLTATAVSSSQINLSWTNSHSLSTFIYRNGSFVTSVGPSANSYADTGLVSGTYNYTVRHSNSSSGLLSDPSNQATATTTAGSPSISITGVSHNALSDNVSVNFSASNVPSGGYVAMKWYVSDGWVSTLEETKLFVSSPAVISGVEHGLNLGVGEFGATTATFFITVEIRNSFGDMVASDSTIYSAAVDNDF
jgi:hypothetical protein